MSSGCASSALQDRVEGGRHREQQFGIGQECEVLLGPRAGVGAVGRHGPVRAGDERGHADHELIGEDALTGPDADRRSEVGQTGAEARPRVHDRLRHDRWCRW